MGLTKEQRLEQEAAIAETNRLVGDIEDARQAILERTGEAWGVSGAVVCPVCGGSLTYYVSSHNGHITAQCNTKGCVDWQE